MFSFRDEVEVVNCSSRPHYNGKKGTIVGFGEDEGYGRSYSVLINGGAISFWESELQLASETSDPINAT